MVHRIEIKSRIPEACLCATSDHEVYDPQRGAYLPITAVECHLNVSTQGAATVIRPTSSETMYSCVQVHDLTLQRVPRNYIANGIVVHNKPPTPPIPPADPNAILADFSSELKAADINSAVYHVDQPVRAKYEVILGDLGPGGMTELAQALDNAILIKQTDCVAQYEVTFVIDGQAKSSYVWLVRIGQEWKIKQL